MNSLRRVLNLWTFPVPSEQYLTATASAASDAACDDVPAAAPATPADRFTLTTASGASVVVESGETILLAAERAGWSPPFGCRNGRCRRCMVDLTRGRVADRRHGLTSGTGSSIQTCVNEPVADVEISL